jgi:hypothetical protein
MFALSIVSLASLSAAQYSDQAAAARVLGPRWKQISRSAGMIFSGTVLEVETRPARKDRPLPLVLVKFRVDRAIAGVRSGQRLTVREWAGAWSTHRAMRSGQRMVIFLYPTSRLGLTSPVGGQLGQIALDANGNPLVGSGAAPVNAALGSRSWQESTPAETASKFDAATSGAKALDERNALTAAVNRCATANPSLLPDCRAAEQHSITLLQLERAIRSARKN